MRDPIRRLTPWLRPEAGPLGWTLVVDLLANVALVTQTSLAAWAVARAVIEHAAPPTWLWWAQGGLVVARMLLTWHEMDISHDVAYRVLAHLRVAVFGGFARGVPRRVDTQHSGRLAASALGGIETLGFFYAHTVPQIACAVVLVVIGTGVLTWVSPALALVLPSAAVLFVVLGLVGARRSQRLGRDLVSAQERLSERVVEAMSGVREIVAYSMSQRMTGTLVGAGREVDEARARNQIDEERHASARDVVTLLAVVVVLWLGGAGPIAAAASVGTLTVLAPVAAAATALTRLWPLRAAAARVVEAVDLVEEGVREREGARPLGDGPWGLQWSGLALELGGRRLHLADGRIAPGERVALVGPSGSGKSSLVMMLSGLWEPDAGSLHLCARGGAWQPLADVPGSQRRRRVAVVDQDATIVHGTLRENVRLGAPEVGDEALREALAVAGLDLGDRRWARGLDTMLGESGVSISGGQRARVALARALVQHPGVLVLDETTASLDPGVERDVMRRLLALGSEVTLVVVSHRASTIDALDRVIDVSCEAVPDGA